MQEWINDASMLDEIAKNFDLPSKKSSLQKIFGFRLNLTLRNRKVEETPVEHWATLRVARKNFSENEVSFIAALARNRTSNSGLEVRSYIHLTTRAGTALHYRTLLLLRRVSEIIGAIHIFLFFSCAARKNAVNLVKRRTTECWRRRFLW